jgi:hypothetical protein
MDREGQPAASEIANSESQNGSTTTPPNVVAEKIGEHKL